MGSRKIRRGSGPREISGKDFHLADEIRYIQRRAATYDGRFVTVGPLALFFDRYRRRLAVGPD